VIHAGGSGMRACLVVLPTFNEAESVAELSAAVLAALPGAELLVVDDSSPDGTASIVKRIAALEPRLHLLQREKKLGLGSAYVHGFLWGLAQKYDRFFAMDADFSHDPSYLGSFVTALDAGADVVVGSRNIPGGGIVGWGLGRHLLSKGGSLYSRMVLGGPVRDMTTGFKAYSRRALERIDVASVVSNGYAFQIETTYRALRAGLKVVEVPIVFVDRRVGQSKMAAADIAEAVLAPLKMRRGNRPSG
jgi:dolichol-phosphate mannosyltransferase